ncbi:hypothetical protein F4778DRAFT_616508 [Xylariomycetidae sp. FL2044]|nr:hypothetical protein F4778DRAFT_616508 [Xylariomycetidae sp. FL2044]
MASAYTPEKVIPTYAAITGVGVALTGVRFWVRTSYVRVPVAADDVAALAAAVFVCAATGMQIANALLGTAGNDVMTADSERRARTALKINWINPVLSPWAFGFIKLSLSLFYRRIFGVWPVFRRINNFLIWLTITYTVAFSLAQLFLCGTHFYLIWVALDQQPARDHCAERGRLQFCYALMSVVTDILVVGLPLVFVGKLQMSTRKKWASAAVFALGFASTGASIARFVYNAEALKYGWFSFAYKPAPGQPKIPSPVFVTLNPTFLAMIEMGFGLWGANLPAISPLMHSFHPLRLMSALYGKATSWTRSSTTSASTRKASTETFATSITAATEKIHLHSCQGSSFDAPPILPYPLPAQVQTQRLSQLSSSHSIPSLNSW